MTMKLFATNRSLLTGLLLFFATCGLAQAGIHGVLTYEIIGDEVTITDCDETATGTVAVPATIEGKPVTAIGSGGFWGCKALTNIVFPESITSLGPGVFMYCESLQEVTFPAGITKIERDMFSFCDSLVKVTFQSDITTIGSSAFGSCSSLVDIILPDSLLSIGEFAFTRCSSLTNFTIPSGVTSVGIRPFDGCLSLLSINVEEGNQHYVSIDGVLFNKDQTDLVSYPLGQSGPYEIPANVTNIHSRAFFKCSSLSIITIPESVTTIGYAAFGSCSELTDVFFIGNAPISFSSYVFSGAASGFSIYYVSDSSGFTSPTWEGYPAFNIENVRIVHWLRGHGFDYDASLDQDINGDGVTLLVAYALNLDPSLDLSGSLPQAEIAADAMGMTFYAASPGITYAVETSTDLQTWTDTDVLVSDLDLEFRRTATVDLTDPHRFLRLRVEQ